ncbi:TaqI-like C-terminal specificity domain-containing protein [Salegentibacter flavus]|uniref:site-specific DNA-methyltransferase (adenine-specific) n=1 Tax=Salegentibacter flavus TaxID=287099 RepID=A0A1I4YHA0_9FLAO|nr:TaqI-like C-terminal specificity domain-containing protein [Salegentibacter flavus]
MALFQVSVLKNYLRLQDEQIVEKAYKKFTKYFHNQTIQENIKSSKEEQFQATFLNELFVNILGYTLNPQPNYNLTTEFKNQQNARKADGAILKDNQAIGVIELKGTNTKHLEGIRQQAFDYKANQKDCIYVITSNFEKLRFYINDATEFIEFDLFGLTRNDFSLLRLCLNYENISTGIPLKIKEASLVKEEAITKDFYKDYSLFKRELYRDLVRRNAKRLKSIRESELLSQEYQDSEKFESEISGLEKNVKKSLFKKSQKLIDRFLFIFFAEDRGLLPPNSIHKIIADWNKLKDLDAEMPLYERFKLYFGYLDTGRKGTDSRAEIFAYNGGLFKPDTILDLLEVDDKLLYKHTAKLATYDFESQVDVNILGHIFENSLNEIESINAEIEGGEFDKQTSKRKKDGVFYTPKYITKYIVENTVGKLCDDKKNELNFHEEEYFEVKKGTHKNTKKKLLQTLDDYRYWLLQLTICDPACGSGAFLNQALDFLIKEHRYIDELKAKVLGGALVFSDIENTILENNIYGVDINEESVEIAKLSLWLRTAQPRRKLNDLSSNIKCGNSLIDDPKVAGKKAFKWEEEFKDVFENGGFDVVIGNPPYVRHELIKEIKPYLKKVFNCFNGTADLYTYFYEKGLKILNSQGKFGFITPNKFIESNYGSSLRKFLDDYNIIKIIDFGELPVFSDAATFPCILIINKGVKKEEVKFTKIESLKFGDLSTYINEKSVAIEKGNWQLNSYEVLELLKKISENQMTLNEYVGGEIKFGLKTGFNEAYVISSEKYESWIKVEPGISDVVKPFMNGTDSRKYAIEDSHEYIIMAKIGEDLTRYPIIHNHLIQFKERLESRSDKGNSWYEFRTCSYYQYFEEPKIIYPDIALESRFSIDYNGRIPNATLFIIPTEDNFLLAVLNSKIGWFYFKNHCPVIGDKSKRGRLRLKTVYVKNLPVPNVLSSQKSKIEALVQIIISLKSEFNHLTHSFQKFLSGEYLLEKLSTKLQKWHELDFNHFIREINKAIKTTNKTRDKEDLPSIPQLNKKDEFEWMELFEDKKKKAQRLKQQIDKTDSEINQMVYELYGLTEEEIQIVENS